MATIIAPIEKDGALRHLRDRAGLPRAYGTRRPVKVGGTIDGHPFTATLMPSGNGPHRLPIRLPCARSSGRIGPAPR